MSLKHTIRILEPMASIPIHAPEMDTQPNLSRILRQKDLSNFGVFWYEQGKYDLALPLLEEALGLRRRVSGKNHMTTLNAQGWLGICLMKQRSYAKAETLLLDLSQRCVSTLGNNDIYSRRSFGYLVKLYSLWNKPEEAAKWKAKLPNQDKKK